VHARPRVQDLIVLGPYLPASVIPNRRLFRNAISNTILLLLPIHSATKASFKVAKKKTNMDGGKVSIEKDPCSVEGKASLKCLNDNNYNRSMCQQAFDNYKACKKFWGSVSLNRSRAGIKPVLPPVDERDAIKREYVRTGKIPTTAPPPSTSDNS